MARTATADTGAAAVAAVPQAQGSSFLSLAAFWMLLVYVVILFVQPQNRFTFLWPLHIADLSFIGAVGLHLMACVQERRPVIRFGPATVISVLLLIFAMLSQYIGEYQASSSWNPYIDSIVKNATLCILLEAKVTGTQQGRRHHISVVRTEAGRPGIAPTGRGGTRTAPRSVPPVP